MANQLTPDEVRQFYAASPPIVKKAVSAILNFEVNTIDPMGYDISYYQEDLPRLVEEAIAPWKDLT